MAASPYAYVIQSCSTFWKGQQFRLSEGDAWKATDPFVKANQHFFRTDPERVFTSDPPPPAKKISEEAVVETATAEPGAKRDVKASGITV